MTAHIIYLVMLSLVLWAAVARLRHAAKELQAEADSAFSEECFHYLVEAARVLAGELHTLRLLLNGRTGITKKQAAKIAIAQPTDGDRWDIRVAALLVVERMSRLGQAVQLGIFDIGTVWDANGESLLATDRRLRPILDESQEANPKIFGTYLYLIDELQKTAASRRAAQLE